jgi:hypothetical protein
MIKGLICWTICGLVCGWCLIGLAAVVFFW